jgi:hypothetical protein
MTAAQQIGVTLGDASATEQPELDHDASFFGGAATYPMQSRIERGGAYEHAVSIFAKALMNQVSWKPFRDRNLDGDRKTEAKRNYGAGISGRLKLRFNARREPVSFTPLKGLPLKSLEVIFAPVTTEIPTRPRTAIGDGLDPSFPLAFHATLSFR